MLGRGKGGSLRTTAEVFPNQTRKENLLAKTFTSAGRFTAQELEASTTAASGQDDTAATNVVASASDAACSGGGGCGSDEAHDDTRPLFDRLKEQRDKKQDKWETEHAFKNQMQHWRLDERDARFEESRRDAIERAAELAAQRRSEGAASYKEARAAVLRLAASVPLPTEAAVTVPRKRKSAARPAVQLVKIRKGETEEARCSASVGGAPASSPQPLGSLPGMDAYGSDSDHAECRVRV